MTLLNTGKAARVLTIRRLAAAVVWLLFSSADRVGQAAGDGGTQPPALTRASDLAPNAAYTVPSTPSVSPAPSHVGWVCFEPRRVLPACFKGDGSCTRRSDPVLDSPPRQTAPRTQPRFRLGKGPWLPLSPTQWRCVPLALGERAVAAIEDHAERLNIPADCPSRRVDIHIDSFYGSMRLRCSKRHGGNDELLPEYQQAPSTAPSTPTRKE